MLTIVPSAQTNVTSEPSGSVTGSPLGRAATAGKLQNPLIAVRSTTARIFPSPVSTGSLHYIPFALPNRVCPPERSGGAQLRLSILLSAGHDGPDHPCRFVGKRRRGDLCRATCHPTMSCCVFDWRYSADLAIDPSLRRPVRR